MTPPVKQRRCPWCRRVVLLDNGNHNASHEAPVCAGFARLVRDVAPAARETGPELREDDQNGAPS